MNTTWSVYGVAAALALLAVVPSKAAGTAGAQFLKVAASARAVAMGEATGATSTDVNALQGNPAGLINVKELQFTASHNSGLVETQNQFLGAARPFGDNVFGVSVLRMDYGDIERYSASNAREGSFSAGSMAAGLSIARNVAENLSLGLTAKFIQEKIDGEGASSFAGDIGLMFHGDRWNLGAAIQNAGPGLKFVEETADLPTTVRLSASRRLLSNKFVLAVDAEKANDHDLSLHGGAEYNVNSAIAIRGGYTATPSNNADLGGLVGLTGGVGLNLGRYSLDYGVRPFGDLGLSHRLSLSARFAQL